jgi:4-alpha-glucanotransferase
MARIVMASPAALAVLPMQDLLGLGKSARLNLPGTATGNWKWCMERGAASKALAQTMRSLIEATGRL